MPRHENQPPILIPDDYLAEFFMLTKAELADILWDYAMQIARVENNRLLPKDTVELLAFNEFRQRRDNVLQRRRKARTGE